MMTIKALMMYPPPGTSLEYYSINTIFEKYIIDNIAIYLVGFS